MIQAGDDGQGPWADICREGQLERQCPSPIGGIRPEVEISVDPLPAHVNRVVLPGEAESIAVDGPEGAIRRNRAFHGSQGFRLPRLGVHSRDA